MKEGWEYKKLKDIGLTQTGTTPSKQISSYYGGLIPFIRPSELNIDNNGAIEYNSELKLTAEGASKSRLIKANSILMCCIGSIGKTGFSEIDVTCNQQINTITPGPEYAPKYVYYTLIAPTFQKEVTKIANSAKATLAIISKGKWEELPIPVPPLSEQHSIVDYLDRSFAKIDAMKANAEKALNEAKALFQASLKELLEPKEGWEEKTLGEFAHMKAGDFVKASDIHSEYEPGLYPCYGGNGLRGYVAEPNQDGEYCLIGRQGALCGNVNLAKGIFRATEHAVVVKPYVNIPPLLTFYLLTHLNINQYATGAAQPGISVKVIEKTVKISVPPKEKWNDIVTTLDSLKSKVDQLQANYDQIAKECDALKQAILRQVFE